MRVSPRKLWRRSEFDTSSKGIAEGASLELSSLVIMSTVNLTYSLYGWLFLSVLANAIAA